MARTKDKSIKKRVPRELREHAFFIVRVIFSPLGAGLKEKINLCINIGVIDTVIVVIDMKGDGKQCCL